MKTLSLKQPWAELILQGKKTIEIRKWNTKFRGKFLIHTSKNSDLGAMKKFGFNELPCGFIVGKAELVDVKHYTNDKEFQKDNNKHLADSEWGEYGFIIKGFIRLAKPIPAIGNLKFWNYEKRIY